MDRAIMFYQDLLGQKVTLKDNIFSKFDIDGFKLCLFNPNEAGEKVKYGDNCLLSFEVDDILEFKKKLELAKTPLVYPLTKIGNNLVLEFKDTEGNDLELYAKV